MGYADTRFLCPGRFDDSAIGRVIPPRTWETMCPDMKRLILSKLSIHELARSARTCREFREESRSRMVTERARLVAVGEETFGPTLFGGFVKCFQSGMRRLDGFPGQTVLHRRLKQLGITGESATKEEVIRRHDDIVGPSAIPYPGPDPYQAAYPPYPPYPVLEANLRGDLSGARGGPEVLIEVNQHFYNREMRLEVWVGEGAVAAAVGLLLAMFGEKTAGKSRFWQVPLSATTIRVLGEGSSSEGEALFDPLRLLAESFTSYTRLPCPNSLPTWAGDVPRRTQSGGVHVLGHLAVIWFAP
jgi:hypothetical protein